MSGTNHTLELVKNGPAIVLVEPQLGENIGMVARAMANFGLADLRLVNPRDGWPSEKARAAASRADHIIDAVSVFATLDEAIGDLNHVYATTARQRDMIKPVLTPREASIEMHQLGDEGRNIGILFGRERWGLENDEVSVAEKIITFPVNPAFASLNIAQAVLLVAYEWMNCETKASELHFERKQPIPAERKTLTAFLDYLENALDEAHYFHPPAKRDRMRMNLHNIFVHAELQELEIHTLHGVIAALERRWMKRSSG
ncbi:MAG: RNA methyltransferase [Pseudomonadota bacterium]